MLKEAINRILELGQAHVIDVGGKSWSSKPLTLIQDPGPSPLTFHTLQGLLDFMNHEATLPDGIFLHVSDPNTVLLYSLLFEDDTRWHYATASAPSISGFDKFSSYEAFIIWVQTRFVQDGETARLLRIVGNIRDENIKTLADDGVTQKVTVSTGLARVSETEVTNPFMLAPFRTFAEVLQPPSPFILRLRGNEAGLFEADGGAWRLTAVQNIAEWLRENGPDGLRVVA